MTWLRSGLWILALMTAAGCDADGKGQDAASDEAGDGGGVCDSDITVLQSVDDVGPSGIAARALVDNVVGVYQGGVRWFFEGPLAATAPAMDGPFTVEVSYAGGEIRDVKATLVEACTDDGPCPCESRVEADFTVRLWSADGMLDETWTITIGHEPQAGGFGRGTYFQHTFAPDTPRGLLSPQTVHQGENVSLLEFVLDARFDQGAVRGSLIANAFAGENMEGFVGASLNDFSGVVAVNAAACETFTDAEGCAGVGCTPVMGEPVHTRADGCFCNPAFVYCLAAPLEGTPEPTMYTRFADGRYSSLDEPHDEVVIFDVRSDTAPGGWRLCTDAPEVAACGCFDDPPTCEPD